MGWGGWYRRSCNKANVAEILTRLQRTWRAAMLLGCVPPALLPFSSEVDEIGQKMRG
jgi:hypothetical protein